MTIRTKFVLSQAVLAVSILLIVSVVMLALEYSNRSRSHLERSYEQLHAITTLALATNTYSEQAAELFILGERGIPGLERARERLQLTLNNITRLVQEERGAAHDAHERLRENIQLERYGRIRTVISDLEASVERLVALLGDGRTEEAVDTYRDEIENRIDREVDRLVAAALADERQEVEAELSYSARLARVSTQLVVGVGVLAGAAGISVAFLLYRTVARPIARLVEGADAVGRGDFSHRIVSVGEDELAQLAARFNVMTSQLEEHRARLLRAQATLEDQVRGRTAELRERSLELETANIRLEEADRSRVRFLADISHELRTPLTVLRGEAEVALRARDLPVEDQRSAFVRIVHKAEQIGKLVDDLLFLARSETGTILFHNEPTPLDEVLAEALRDASVLSVPHEIRIALTLPSSPIIANCDQQRLKQALLIVLDNAIKYSPPGTVVRVELSLQDGHAAMRISNAASDLSDEELAHAFDRSFRGPRARSGTTRGSGLGLPIARWIMERQGGTIELTNAPELGATVTMRLPAMLCQEGVGVEDVTE